MDLFSRNDSQDEDSVDWTQSWDDTQSCAVIPSDQSHSDDSSGKLYCLSELIIITHISYFVGSSRQVMRMRCIMTLALLSVILLRRLHTLECS